MEEYVLRNPGLWDLAEDLFVVSTLVSSQPVDTSLGVERRFFRRDHRPHHAGRRLLEGPL